MSANSYVLLLMLTAAHAQAAPQSIRPAPSQQKTYTPQIEHFRILNGKVYNVELSTLWKTQVKDLSTGRWTLEAVRIESGGLLVRQSRKQIVGYKENRNRTDSMARIGLYSGKGNGYVAPAREPIYGDEVEYGQTLWIQYATRLEGLSSSAKLFNLGTTNLAGTDVAAYSIGLPNTLENRAASGIE